MNLTSFCIKRPVFSTILSLIIVVLGYVAFKQLQVRQYPQVEFPRVSVVTQLEGASPQIIESQITKILEDALAGIEGLNQIYSTSDTGESKITMVFDLDRPIDSAVNDVRDKIGRVRNKLPNEATEPRIRKADADATSIISLALTSDTHTIEELADYSYRFLENQINTLPGVSSVDIYGGGEYEMRIVLDPVKMANFKVTADEIAAAVKKQNVEKPAGNIKTKNEEIIVTTRAPLLTEKDFDNLILGERQGALVRLKDVGHAELGTVDDKSNVLFNGKPAIAISIIKQSVANPLTIAQALDKKLPNIERGLPHGMKLSIASDNTIFIDRSIQEVYQTLFEASALVILVILIFLRSPSALIIPIVTIPVSLVGTFFLMYIFGFSINILTLLALVLAIGMVVDDAIVMLENIYRYIEEGMKPIQAAFKGAREISFAIVAMTLTLAAVYAPIALSPGLTGRLFTEFAVTLASSVFISGFVALTLSPMMCGRLLRRHDLSLLEKDQKPKSFKDYYTRFDLFAEKMLNSLDLVYGRSLNKLLSLDLHKMLPHFKGNKVLKKENFNANDHPFFSGSILIVGIGVVLAALGFIASLYVKSEFLPNEDQGILVVKMSPLSSNANLEFVSRYARQADDIVKQIPEVENRLDLVQAPGEFRSLNTLVPWEKRDRSIKEVIDTIQLKLMDIPGINAYAYSGGSKLGSGRSEKPIQIVLKSTLSFEELRAKTYEAMRYLREVPGVYEIEADTGTDAQEYEVTIDREKAASLGVEVDQIASTLDTLVGGKPVSKFRRDSKLYSVKIMVNKDVQSTVEDLTNVFIRGRKNNKDTLVPLSEVITVDKKLSPISILHYDGFRAVTLYARLHDNVGLKDALIGARDLLATRIADSTTQVDFAGEAKRFFDEERNIEQIFILALLFIYLVLAAQYESWRDPMIIMLSVPLSLAGGAIFLWLFGQSLNLYSQIGFVTLVGLITKHGILIVDFANALKEEGETRLEAVIKAARLRLRPILMTTLAMVLGAVPLAMAMGAGMESRRPIGLVIVGGMVVGTLFTLYVVPAVYTLISRKKPKAAIMDETEAAQ